MMERCGKCGMVEESSIHDINSPDTEIRRVAHHFELVAPCPRCAIKDAALAAANASCLTDLPASFRPEDAKAFHDQITVRKL